MLVVAQVEREVARKFVKAVEQAVEQSAHLSEILSRCKMPPDEEAVEVILRDVATRE